MTEWILTSSVLILLVLAVRGLFKNKMKAKAVYALWLIVLVRLLCPVNFGELSFNLLSLAEEGKAQVQEHLEQQQAEKQQELQQDTVAYEGVFTLPDNAAVYYPPMVENQGQMHTESPAVVPETKTEATGAVPAEEPAGFSFPEISWQKVLPYAWIIGMVCMTVVIFGVNISFSTTLGMLRKELPLLERKGRGKKALSVYLADGINSSCLYGVVHPSIYLNEQGMDDREKTYCVEHEYSHYLQGDMVWSLCRTICLVLHWYNPLVWVAVMLSKKDAELASDERTIERLGEEERYSYGHTLVELAAKQSRAVQMFGMATLMASDKKEVVERVKAITTKKQTKIITGLLVAVLVVGIGFFVFTGEAKGEQDKNKNEVAQVTETPAAESQTNTTPAPTMDPALEEFIEKSKAEYSRGELLNYILDTNSFPVEGRVEAFMLNVRKAAGYDADRIDVLSEGTTVMINAVEQDADGKYWYAVTYDQKDSNWIGAEKDGKEKKNGYVYSAYLSKTRAVPTACIEEMEFPTVGVMTTSMYLRPAPGYEYMKANPVEKETPVTIFSAEQDKDGHFWYYVGYSWGDGYTARGYADSSCVFVDEASDVSAERFRLYKSKDINGEYTELINAEHTLSGVHYGGNGWFYTETWNNQSGWVLYGSADTVDRFVHKMLKITADEWEVTKEQKELELVLSVKEANYKELSFVDHVALKPVNGEGWSVDLNGDKVKENLYIDTNGVFINGERVFTTGDARNEYWLLDIDTTDSFYELLNGNGDLYIYDGTGLQVVGGILEYYFTHGNSEKETWERYLGTLGSFVRIDKHTISFENYHSDWNGFAVASYRLNENHDLCRIEKLSEVRKEKTE